MSSERDCLWEGRPESNFDLDDRREEPASVLYRVGRRTIPKGEFVH
jgi:hypothetical protein